MPADVVSQGIQDDTPVSTKGFGAREDSDATRQAQHEMANDTPTDVNLNAVVAREQAGTFTQMGKEFLAHSTRLGMMQEQFIGRLGQKGLVG